MKKEKFLTFIFLIIFSVFFTNNIFAQSSDNTKETEKQEQIEQVQEEKSDEKKTKDEKDAVKKFGDSFEKFLEDYFPFPILSWEVGYPEIKSFEIGLESLFYEFKTELRTGVYFSYSYSESADDNFYRIGIGSATGYIGIVEWRFGGGCGFMPRNGDTLNTAFFEAVGRLFVIDLKLLCEFPISPGNLKEYYYDKYFPLKIKIGLSI
ncbi:MAG: hypothetical protein K6E97_07545 [Treponema sp.]|nr:hypothetical protein [Treponema sp.]